MITDIKGTFKLSNGVDIPYLGLGVFQMQDDQEIENAIQWAFDYGYRHIDTASIYGNEKGVGRAIKNSELTREDFFVVSKVWNSDQGYESTIRAFENSLQRLQLEYLDLYLIHWPVKGKYQETWKAMEYLYAQGKIRAIGVSNFLKHHLDNLLHRAEVVPMINQMEFHPRLVQQDLLDYCTQNGILYEAWSPIMKGEIFQIDSINKLADKYQKSEAQIVLRWDLQKGVVTIPKSSKKHRIHENAEIFDFEISAEDMQVIDQLDKKFRTGPDPDNFNF